MVSNVISQAAAHDPAYETLQDLGDCCVAAERWSEARECYAQAAALAPARAAPFVALGAVAFQTGQYEQARQAFQIALRKEPDHPAAHGGLAMVYQQTGDHPAAFDCYLRCLELDGDNLVALLGLFQTSSAMGTFAKIIHFLEVYLSRHGEDHAVLFCLASLYARDGQYRRAADALQQVLRAEPGKADARQLLDEVRKHVDAASPPRPQPAPACDPGASGEGPA